MPNRTTVSVDRFDDQLLLILLAQQFMLRLELAQRTSNVYVNKPLEVKGVDGIKVRLMTPPQTYDDTGRLKKWTQKELIALRGKTSLPGYPGELEHVHKDQYVDFYSYHYYLGSATSIQNQSPNSARMKLTSSDA